MALYLQRDTKVFLEKEDGSTKQYWEIPVLEGFSFTQGNDTSEVTLNEMSDGSGRSRRGRMVFNDALSPADWSFSTYIRPFISTGTAGGLANKASTALNHHLVEEALWANFIGDGGWSATNSALKEGQDIATEITTNFTGGTNGVYEIDQLEYSTNGNGINATFEITVDSGAVTDIIVRNAGTGFASGNTITFSKYMFGAASADLVVTLIAGNIDSTQTAAYDYELENFLFGTGSSTFNMAGSNQTELGLFNLYFVMGAQNATTANNYVQADIDSNRVTIYKLTDCTINEASINFDVDGIAQIDWSGNATTISDYTSPLNMTAASGADLGVVNEGVNKTNNFIRNKLAQISVTSKKLASAQLAGAGDGVYNFTLTGGSITITNNISYLTPEVLGIVNTPLGHITGNKSITGSFTCYVTAGTAGDSADFYNDMNTTEAKELVTNEFDITFKLGGATGTPRFEINMPTAHIEIPEVNIEDVISLNMNFHGLPSSIDEADEANFTLVGA
jgi:hypothetical protein